MEVDQLNQVGEVLKSYKQLAEEGQSRAAKSGGSDTKNSNDGKCPKCGGDYYLAKLPDGRVVRLTSPDAVGQLVDAVPCECLKELRIQKLFKSSYITEDFTRLTFDNFNVKGRPQSVGKAKAAAMSYLKNFDNIRGERYNSIALLGRPGSGKTHLLTAISNELMRRCISVMYFPWVEGSNELRDNFDKLEQKLTMMKTVDVLFIDDLFKGRKSPTEFQLEQMFGVVNYRYLNHLPILLSSERTIEQICEIDEGLGSRIFEMAKRYTVIMGLTEAERRAGMELNYRLA